MGNPKMEISQVVYMRLRVWYRDGFDDVEEEFGLFYGGAEDDRRGVESHDGSEVVMFYQSRLSFHRGNQ